MASNFIGFIVEGEKPKALPEVEPGEELKITNAALSGKGRAELYVHHGDEKFLLAVLDESKNIFQVNLEVVLSGQDPVPVAFSIKSQKGTSVHLTGFCFFNPADLGDSDEEEYSFSEDESEFSDDDEEESDDEGSSIGIEEIKTEDDKKKTVPTAKVKVIPGQKKEAPAPAQPAAPAKPAAAPAAKPAAAPAAKPAAAKPAAAPAAKPAAAPAKQAPKKEESSDDESESDSSDEEESPKAKSAPSSATVRCDPCGKNFTSQVALKQHDGIKHKGSAQAETPKKAPEAPKKAQETPKKAPETPKKEAEAKKAENTPKKPEATPKKPAESTPKKEIQQKPKHVDTPKPKPTDDKKRKPSASQGNVANKKPKVELD